MGLILALAVAVASIIMQNRWGLPFVKQVFGKKSLWTMLMVIAAIFIFKDIMQSAGIVEEMAGAAN